MFFEWTDGCTMFDTFIIQNRELLGFFLTTFCISVYPWKYQKIKRLQETISSQKTANG